MSNYAIRETTSAPVNGTTAVYTLTISGSSGTYRLGVGSQVTSALAFDANAAAIQAAVQAMSLVGSGNAIVTGDTSPHTITMAGTLVKLAYGPLQLRLNSTNGTVTLAESTPGVNATQRTAPYGAELIDSVTGIRYRNRSTTVNAPDWRRVRNVSHLNVYLPLPDITAATLYTYTPGVAGKIIKHDAAVETIASTTTKAATLTWKIAGTGTTGGGVALTTTNCNTKGAAVAGSTVTAANTFTATDVLTLVGSAVTTFVEGAIWDVLQLELDEAP